MGQLTKTETRELDQLEAVLDAFQVAYMDAGRALIVIRDKELHRDADENFDIYVRTRFGYSKGHTYRLISAYEAVQDVQKVESPNGRLLPPPQNERVARELAVVEKPEQRADLWSEVAKTQETPTAAHVAKVRKEMFGASPAASTLNQIRGSRLEAIKTMISKIHNIRKDIDEVQPGYKKGNKAWQRALDQLDSAGKALLELTK